MAEKASGVYADITDNSINTTDNVDFGVIFAGFSQRGNELSDITYSNYETVIGYNTIYDNRVRGVKDYLSISNNAKFMRLNQNMETRYVSNPSVVTTSDPLEFKIGLKNGGTWGLSTLQLTVVPKYNSVMRRLTPSSGTAQIDLSFFSRTQSIVITRTVDNVVIYKELTSGVLTAMNGATGSGSVTRSSSALTTTLKFTGITSTDTTGNCIIEYLDADYNTYDCKLYEFIGTRTLLASLEFSTNPSSSIYYTECTSDYLKVDYCVPLINYTSLYSDNEFTTPVYYTLSEGSDGDIETSEDFSVDNMSFKVLDTTDYPIVVLNGVTSIDIINAFVSACASRNKTCLVDLPAFDTYAAAREFSLDVASSEYRQLYWIPTVTKFGGSDVYIWPSVYVAESYARMYSNTGRYSSAPAGYTYASVDHAYVLQTDYADHVDELKTNNINYIKSGNNGLVIWEQKTGYAKSSDLSYASTISIIRQIEKSLLSFADNFLFDKQTPETWTSFIGGVKSILDDAVDVGDLTKYDIDAPTWTELEANHSRTVDVVVGLYVMQDYEVFNFHLYINK